MSIHLVNKKYGKTPLEALEKLRAELGFNGSVPMTYAGRLDPLATGLLIILSGEDVHKKEDFLGLDKDYEVDLVFGLYTDTGDLLGMPTSIEGNYSLNTKVIQKTLEEITDWAYPAFSSKTVDGKPLFELEKSGQLKDKPLRKMSFKVLNIEDSDMSGEGLRQKALKATEIVNGDFRQGEIKKAWQDLKINGNLQLLRIEITATSGTYMRSIPEILKAKLNLDCVVSKIYRTRVGDYLLPR